MLENEWEYKLIEGDAKNIQTKLNQWRHDYKIIIEQMVDIVNAAGIRYAILLKRSRVIEGPITK